MDDYPNWDRMNFLRNIGHNIAFENKGYLLVLCVAVNSFFMVGHFVSFVKLGINWQG